MPVLTLRSLFSPTCLLACMLVLLGFVAHAQRHNPKYDEWLRKQGIKVVSPKVDPEVERRRNRRTMGGAFSASVGVFSATATTKFGASPSGYASGTMENYGFGPAITLALGNIYSPVFNMYDNEFLYGFAFTVGRGFGSARLLRYSQGWDGINGDRPGEFLRDLESKPGYRSNGQHTHWNATFNLGAKALITSDFTLGFLAGFGLDSWTVGADIWFQDVKPTATEDRYLWGTYRGYSISGNLETYILYQKRWFGSLKVSGSVNPLAWMVATSVVGGSTITLSVGARLPFDE